MVAQRAGVEALHRKEPESTALQDLLVMDLVMTITEQHHQAIILNHHSLNKRAESCRT